MVETDPGTWHGLGDMILTQPYGHPVLDGDGGCTLAAAATLRSSVRTPLAAWTSPTANKASWAR